jgi:hypothetical protein
MIQDKRDIRLRVLGALSICLFSSGRPSKTGWFVILQTLFQALFSLQGSLLAEGDSEGASYVHELITGVRKVGCEGLDASLLMQQYGVQLRSEADAQAVLDCVVIMALAICTENATGGEHRYILSNVMAAKVGISCVCWSMWNDCFIGKLVQCCWVITLLTELDAH